MIIRVTLPIPPSTLFSAAYAADLLGLTEQTLLNWRKARSGPPFAYADGQIMYRLADIQRWSVTHDVERFVKLAREIDSRAVVDLPVVPPHDLDGVLDDIERVVRPAHRVTRKAKRSKPSKTWRAWAATYPVKVKRRKLIAPPAPEPPAPTSPPPPDQFDVSAMSAQPAIVSILEAIGKPMSFRDLIDYLKHGGYKGSMGGIGPALNTIKAKGTIKRSDDGWILNRE